MLLSGYGRCCALLGIQGRFLCERMYVASRRWGPLSESGLVLEVALFKRDTSITRHAIYRVIISEENLKAVKRKI